MPEATQLRPSNITLGGTEVRVWTGGQGPALLLLHAAWGDAELSWQPVWEMLSSRFTVIAPDLPGFGSSRQLSHPSLSANAELLRNVLDNCKSGRAVVAGNSYGAAVAIEFASRFPESTRRLVIVNGGYLPVLPAFVRTILSLPPVERRFRALMRSVTYSDKAFAKAFPDASRLPPGFIARIRRNEENQARAVFDTFSRQESPQQRPLAPATVLWGTGDRLVTARQLRAVRRWLGNAAFVPIEGAGHMPQVERPKEFVDAMVRISTP